MKFFKVVVLVALVTGAAFIATGKTGWWSSSTDKAVAGETLQLDWEDLIPADFSQPENPFDTMTQEEIDKLLDGSDESNAELARLEVAFNYAPTVASLDGKRIKLAAYVTPLDFDGQMQLKEFLLVPYMGACIHTPPPPANQIVHALSPSLVELHSPYDPVWAIGVLHTETVTSDLAEAGYRLEVESVLPYTEPEPESESESAS